MLTELQIDVNKIKHVAIYLRKSRSLGDEEEDLIKHRKVIHEVCVNNNWSYIEYVEIVSGDTIEARPKMQTLLKDVKNNQFDAVIVFDIDRLGRGGGGDRELIGLTLQHSDTFLITTNPYKIYDLNNDSDEQVFDMHSFMGRYEYKMINKRLQAGKRVGLRMGRWVSGSCPYGYYNDTRKKQLIVIEEEKKVIRLIVEEFLYGTSINNIAWSLNKKGIPSPRDSKWTVPTISRMLKSQVYLGYVVGNKSEGNRGRVKSSSSKPFRYLPENEWVIVKNCHEAIISEEEYEKIQKLFDSKARKIYKNTIYPFTGLIICGKCKKNMHHKNFGNNMLGVSRCSCGNYGGSTELIEDAIFTTINSLKDRLNNMKNDDVKKQKENLLLKRIKNLTEECEKQELALERIEEAFEEGLYDIQKTRQKTQEREQEKWNIEKELSKLKKEMESVNSHGNEERLSSIDKFLNDINNSNNGEIKNQLYKELLSEVIWTRSNNREVEIIVNFL